MPNSEIVSSLISCPCAESLAGVAILGGGDASINRRPGSVDERGRDVVGVSHESGSDRRSAFVGTLYGIRSG